MDRGCARMNVNISEICVNKKVTTKQRFKKAKKKELKALDWRRLRRESISFAVCRHLCVCVPRRHQ